jgi:hypothetical protein
MQKDYYPNLTSLEDVARHYRQTHASRIEREMEWFASPLLALPEAIERACESVIDGRLHSHQQRPFQRRPQAPKKAADLLKPLANRIAAARNFDDDLYPLVCAKLASVLGIGLLTYYDFTHRIGARLNPKLAPIQVFLHRGTREGVKALGLRVDRDRAPISDFPEGLRSLTAAQLEDLLCIYRGTLARIAGSGQVETAPRGIPRCVVAPEQPQAPRPGRC